MDEGRAAEVADRFSIALPVARAILARGVSLDTDIEAFLAPVLKNISDPFLIENMEAACRRLWAAVTAKQRILIYGDYDCDGITASALLYRFLKGLGHPQVDVFIPDRLDDGYGLIADCVERCIAEYKPELIITVDCGVNSAEEVELIKSRGIDVIVTDHHEPAARTADPDVLVNPKIGSPGKMANLAGVGVAFMLAYGTMKISGFHKETGAVDVRDLLGLVALGTVTDIVPLTHDNRIMVSAGVERWRRGPVLAGIAALMEFCNINAADLEAWHFGFMIGPRINAAGRLGRAGIAFRALITDDPAEALELARELDSANRERKEIEEGVLKEAIRIVEQSDAVGMGIVVGKTGWHAGTLGIVASRLAGRYNRPVVVIAIDDCGNGKGSCRSVGGVNLAEVLDECDDLLTGHGGHAMAAGLSLKAERLDEFAKRFAQRCAVRCEGDAFPDVIEFDGWLNPSDLTEDFCRQLDVMAPLGMGNPSPLWGLAGVAVSSVRIFKDRHLSFMVRNGKSDLKAIGFSMVGREPELADGPIDMIFEAKLNTFRGRTSVDLVLKDFRPSDFSEQQKNLRTSL